MNPATLAPWPEAMPDAPPPPLACGLHEWPLRRPAVVQALADAPDAESRRTLHRLAEIGFLPGEPVEVVARGWLRGSPIAVRVGSSTFALRTHEAALLRVTEQP
jgi:ferrous iron transport protein A